MNNYEYLLRDISLELKKANELKEKELELREQELKMRATEITSLAHIMYAVEEMAKHARSHSASNERLERLTAQFKEVKGL
ncbi:hypothetical protein B4064_1691 [Caldibacillus thermoamylovorans]|jgi:hypothetical protein|uniref:Uncharacterized protein n=2 Tax=Bacillaceae TaxID=186817 RepID=A0A0D0G9M6_9BACI|nr:MULTISPECIES: hypothetical protein [Bacillaceae]AWI10913.1 hypothetical protein CQJ30_01080 [Caldibacillus thermoamylovorans]KIO66923.1 hypothetical protein B4166_2468 [Caldibacillus thermoamylovorans]KIO67891.1 hypothetical protein B4065_1796 [Caldibacillus thermoamylovorans]KIO68535.1 hypothetical protein B4064_1691 [Caldibacillus thermoamylovorans]KIO73907.1 hypothetical protein B4167_1740 [Caldibacillus thermoamylovorans]